MTDFQEAIRSDNRRVQLTALRDLLAESIADLHDSIRANQGLCRRCGGSLSEAGLASLAQRLTQTMDALDGLADDSKPKTKLELIREQQAKRAGVADTPDTPSAVLGTKSAERRKGSRRTGILSGPAPGPVASPGAGEVFDPPGRHV